MRGQKLAIEDKTLVRGQELAIENKTLVRGQELAIENKTLVRGQKTGDRGIRFDRVARAKRCVSPSRRLEKTSWRSSAKDILDKILVHYIKCL